MLARYSLRELTHHRLRTLLALLGVSVATAMLVDMLMLGGGIERSFAELLGARGFELRVSPKGTLPFDTEATITGFSGLRDTLDVTPGVAGIAPVLASAVILGVEDGASAGPGVRAFALGIGAGRQGLLRLIDGELPGPGQVLVGGAAVDLGVGLGDALEVRVAGGLGVAGRSVRFRVSGIGEFLYAARGDVPIALELQDLQRLSGKVDEVSFAMIQVVEGSDPEAVRAALLETATRVEIVTLAGIVAEASERLSYFRQLALILGSVSLIVTSLLVGTIMAVSISERLGTIAALRAIGISRRSIVGGLTAESLILCAVAGALGLGLGIVVSGYLESILSDFPGLPQAVQFFVLRPQSVVLAYALLLVVGGLAGLVPAWNATRMEVATLLHVEEP